MSSDKVDNIIVTFRFLRNLSTIVGLPFFYTSVMAKTHKVLVFIYDCYVAMIDIILFTAALRFYGRLLLEASTTAAVIEAAAAVGFVTQAWFRTLVLKRKRKFIDSYLAKINDIEYIAFVEEDLGFIESFKNKYKTGRRAATCLIASQVMGSFATFLIAPFFWESEKDLMPASYPFKNLNRYVKHFYQFHDLSTALYIITRSVCIDILCISLINFHAFQQQCLKTKLRSIMLDIKSSGKNYQTEKGQIHEWLRYHQESLRNIDELKKFLEPLLLASYVYSLINVVTILVFTLVKGDMTIMQKLLGGGSIFVCFVFLGWFCIAIDELRDQLEEMPLQLDPDQVAQDPGLKSTYLILGPRCYKKLKISAMGLFTLSARGFAEVISASFSALATFWQLRSKVLR